MLPAVCGSCNDHHETIDEYRVCAGVGVKEFKPKADVDVMDSLTGTKTTSNPPSDKQVKYALDLLESRVWPDGFSDEDLRGMERRVVSELIERLHKAPRKDRRVGANGVKDDAHSIPDGRYALNYKSKGGDDWRFFEIKRGHTRTFLNLLIGSPGQYRKQAMYGNAAKLVFDMIREVTPRQASVDYGLKSEVCGVCSSPLTNAESLKLGIGPVCRSKMGW